MEFKEFDLHPALLEGIESLNYKTATPIQQQAIPVILEGRDLIACAQTGTGKTAAFVLPVINQIIESGESGFTQALVVVPTRELAVQIDQFVEAYSYFTGVSSIAIYGGSDGKVFARERQAIESGADILIVTPGRFLAHANMGYVKLDDLRFLILDEADRMLDMGFQPDLLRIFKLISSNPQTLMFSATMPSEIRSMAKQHLKNPFQITIALSKPAAGVSQACYFLGDDQKIPLLVDMLRSKIGQRIIVFASTKTAVNQLYRKLIEKKVPAQFISSDLEQADREKTMNAFRSRQVDILVATDVLSRGIDVEGIDMVINFDVPGDAEDYVHRIGRTARAERKGEALTLVSPKDARRFQRIEKLIERQVERLELPDGLGAAPLFEATGHRGGGRDRGGRPQNRPNGPRPQNQNRQKSSHPPAKQAKPAAPSGEEQPIEKKKRRRPRGGKGRRGPSSDAKPPSD